MSFQNMQFSLHNLTLDDVVWLRDHYQKSSGVYHHISIGCSGSDIATLTFSTSISVQQWDIQTSRAVEELLARFKPTSS